MLQNKSHMGRARRWSRSTLVPVLALVALEGSACAMTSPQKQALTCSVRYPEKLPQELGGAHSVCGAITRTIAPAMVRDGAKPVAIEVTVVSDSRLKAAVSVGGTRLPEQNVGISDRPLNARAVEMLANAIAAQLSNAAL